MPMGGWLNIEEKSWLSQCISVDKLRHGGIQLETLLHHITLPIRGMMTHTRILTIQAQLNYIRAWQLLFAPDLVVLGLHHHGPVWVKHRDVPPCNSEIPFGLNHFMQILQK